MGLRHWKAQLVSAEGFCHRSHIGKRQNTALTTACQTLQKLNISLVAHLSKRTEIAVAWARPTMIRKNCTSQMIPGAQRPSNLKYILRIGLLGPCHSMSGVWYQCYHVNAIYACVPFTSTYICMCSLVALAMCVCVCVLVDAKTLNTRLSFRRSCTAHLCLTEALDPFPIKWANNN